jgi:hypothetical protein
VRSWALMPEGQCWVSLVDGDLVIDRADPRITIAEELVSEWRQGNHHPTVSLDGDLLRVQAKNRTVIYRLVEHVPEYHAWIAEWPD